MADIDDPMGQLSGGGGGRGVGGGGGSSPTSSYTGTLSDHLISPPKNLTVKLANNGASLLVTFTSQQSLAFQVNKAAWYRLYYLSAREVSQTSASAFYDTLHGLLVFPADKRHWVTDVPVASGDVTTYTTSITPYLYGGWFYASGVNAAGYEGFTTTPGAPLPIALAYAAPLTEVKNQAVSISSVSTINGLKYGNINVSWTSNNTDTIVASGGAGGVTIVPSKYVQIYVSNYAKSGTVWEGPVYLNSPVGSTSNTFTFPLACDDGTGGYPDPGAHAVTFYFVSLSPSYSHRPDPTGAPSAALATGVHS